MKKLSNRAEHALEQLNRLRHHWDHYDGNRAAHLQFMDAWLESATSAEVRKGWQKSWGSLPSWAKK